MKSVISTPSQAAPTYTSAICTMRRFRIFSRIDAPFPSLFIIVRRPSSSTRIRPSRSPEAPPVRR